MQVKYIRGDNPKTEEPVLVHVVAWHYNTGSGFDWFRMPADADKAFEAEKENCDDMKDEGWSAYRFDFTVSSLIADEEITSRIQRVLDELCVKAAIKHENVLIEYGCTLSEIETKAELREFTAVGFSYINKMGGTNCVMCSTYPLTASQELLARYRDQRVKWLARFKCRKSWRDDEVGGQMIGEPINKELKAFLKRHANPQRQVIYVNRMELAANVK